MTWSLGEKKLTLSGSHVYSLRIVASFSNNPLVSFINPFSETIKYSYLD